MDRQAAMEATYRITVLNNPWIPHVPHPKQREALLNPSPELLYGGAARGGKSDFLLMCAAQYVHVPGYAAIIFRKTLPELEQPDGLIPRSLEWWAGSPARWNGQNHEWTFPSGAKIKFGFVGADYSVGTTKFRYQGMRVQCVCWDELTSQMPEDYFYLFSRLDRPNCEKHRPGGQGEWNETCQDCQIAKVLSWVPLRVRAATNPGGVGMRWVREHFGIERDPITREWVGRNAETAFIPAYVRDNPAVDQEAYIENLGRMKDHVTRKQLLEGDWEISEEGRFKPHWCKRFTVETMYDGQNVDATNELWQGEEDKRSNVLRGLHQGSVVVKDQRIMLDRCRIFMTVDPAASEREGPGDTQRYRKAPSNSVFSTWILTPQIDLLWLDCHAVQCEVPDGVQVLRKLFSKWRPEFIGIEANGSNIGFFQYAQRTGLPVRAIQPGSADKLVRSTDAQIRMENGKVLLPRSAPWLRDTEREVFEWTGHKQEPADRVDTLSYAAMLVSQESGWNRKPLFDGALPTVQRVY